jgi:hypothetical protein
LGKQAWKPLPCKGKSQITLAQILDFVVVLPRERAGGENSSILLKK